MIQFVLFTLVFAYIFHRLTLSKSLARSISEFYFNRVKYNNAISRREYIEINRLLTKKVPFYTELDVDGKAKFIARCMRFINTCEWDFRGRLQPTRDAQYLIASSAIQITFGFDQDFLYPSLQKIIIFPSSFYNGMLKRRLKGGSTRTRMMLSWEHTLEGFADPSDNLNLALHEFAHSLKLNAQNGSIKTFFTQYIDYWLAISEEEKLRLKEEEETFLRKYGGTNDHEFFAVAVEHFFESPEDFRRELPDIFNHLCVLLNLNPLSPQSNYELTSDYIQKINSNRLLIPVPKVKKIQASVPNKYYTNLMAFGLVASIIIVMMFDDLLISDYTTLGFLAITFFAGLFAAKKSLIDQNVMTWPVYFLFVFMGYVPLQTLVYITLNERILMESHENTYPVIDKEYSKHGYYFTTPNALINRTSAVKFPYEGAHSPLINNKELYLSVTYAEGWLGTAVITNSVLLTASASPQ